MNNDIEIKFDVNVVEGIKNLELFRSKLEEIEKIYASTGSATLDLKLGSAIKDIAKLETRLNSLKTAMDKLSGFGKDVKMDGVLKKFDRLSERLEKVKKLMTEINAFNLNAITVSNLANSVDDTKRGVAELRKEMAGLVGSLNSASGLLKKNAEISSGVISITENFMKMADAVKAADAQLKSMEATLKSMNFSNLAADLKAIESGLNSLERAERRRRERESGAPSPSRPTPRNSEGTPIRSLGKTAGPDEFDSISAIKKQIKSLLAIRETATSKREVSELNKELKELEMRLKSLQRMAREKKPVIGMDTEIGSLRFYEESLKNAKDALRNFSTSNKAEWKKIYDTMNYYRQRVESLKKGILEDKLSGLLPEGYLRKIKKDIDDLRNSLMALPKNEVEKQGERFKAMQKQLYELKKTYDELSKKPLKVLKEEDELSKARRVTEGVLAREGVVGRYSNKNIKELRELSDSLKKSLVNERDYATLIRINRELGVLERKIAAMENAGKRNFFQRLKEDAAHVFDLFAGYRILTAIENFARDTITLGKDFEYIMKRIEVVSGATTESMKILERQAKDLGASTMFSSKQAAEAMLEFATAGLTSTQIMQAMPAALDLAAAGTLDLAEAVNGSVSIMNAFQIQAEQLAGVNDILVEAANRGTTTVRGMVEAFRDAAPAAFNAGLSIQETAAALVMMQNAGIPATMAGTAFRSAIVQLANPLSRVSRTLKLNNVELYDQHGRLKNLTEMFAEFRKKGINAAELQSLLGAEGGRLAIVYSKGAEAVASLTSFMEKAGPQSLSIATGFKDAAGYLKNFRYEAEKLSKIKGYDPFGPMKKAMDDINNMVLSTAEMRKISQDLLNPTTATSKLFSDFNLPVFDAEGHLRGITEISKIMQAVPRETLLKKMIELEDKNMNALLMLYDTFEMQNTSYWQSYEEAIGGVAAKVAAMQRKTMKGLFDEITSSAEAFSLELYKMIEVVLYPFANALLGIVKAGISFLNFLSDMADFLKRNQDVALVLILSLARFEIALTVAIFRMIAFNSVTTTMITLARANAGALLFGSRVMAAYAASANAAGLASLTLGNAMATLGTRIKLLALAFRAVPWFWTVTAVTAVIGVLYALIRVLTDTSDETDRLIKLKREMLEASAEEISKMNELVDSMKISILMRQEYTAELERLNSEYEAYLPYIVQEINSLEELTNIQKQLTRQIYAATYARMQQKKLETSMMNIAEAQLKLLEGKHGGALRESTEREKGKRIAKLIQDLNVVETTAELQQLLMVQQELDNSYDQQVNIIESINESLATLGEQRLNTVKEKFKKETERRRYPVESFPPKEFGEEILLHIHWFLNQDFISRFNKVDWKNASERAENSQILKDIRRSFTFLEDLNDNELLELLSSVVNFDKMQNMQKSTLFLPHEERIKKLKEKLRVAEDSVKKEVFGDVSDTWRSVLEFTKEQNATKIFDEIRNIEQIIQDITYLQRALPTEKKTKMERNIDFLKPGRGSFTPFPRDLDINILEFERKILDAQLQPIIENRIRMEEEAKNINQIRRMKREAEQNFFTDFHVDIKKMEKETNDINEEAMKRTRASIDNLYDQREKAIRHLEKQHEKAKKDMANTLELGAMGDEHKHIRLQKLLSVKELEKQIMLVEKNFMEERTKIEIEHYSQIIAVERNSYQKRMQMLENFTYESKKRYENSYLTFYKSFTNFMSEMMNKENSAYKYRYLAADLEGRMLKKMNEEAIKQIENYIKSNQRMTEATEKEIEARKRSLQQAERMNKIYEDLSKGLTMEDSDILKKYFDAKYALMKMESLLLDAENEYNKAENEAMQQRLKARIDELKKAKEEYQKAADEAFEKTKYKDEITNVDSLYNSLNNDLRRLEALRQEAEKFGFEPVAVKIREEGFETLEDLKERIKELSGEMSRLLSLNVVLSDLPRMGEHMKNELEVQTMNYEALVQKKESLKRELMELNLQKMDAVKNSIISDMESSLKKNELTMAESLKRVEMLASRGNASVGSIYSPYVSNIFEKPDGRPAFEHFSMNPENWNKRLKSTDRIISNNMLKTGRIGRETLDIYQNLHNKMFLIGNMLDYWKRFQKTAEGTVLLNEIKALEIKLKIMEPQIEERRQIIEEMTVKMNDLFSAASQEKFGVDFMDLSDEKKKSLILEVEGLSEAFKEAFGDVNMDDIFAQTAELGKYKEDFDKTVEELEKKSAELSSKIKDRNREIYLNTVEAIHDAAQTVIDGLRTYWGGYIQFLDKVITGQAEKVQKLRERINKDKQSGDAEQLQLEEERLDKMQKMKEEYVRKQQALATIELITNSMVAIAKTIATAGNPALAAVFIALTLAQLAFGLAAARQAAEQASAKDVVGFRKGGYTGDRGREMYGDKDVAGVVHKGEFVFPEDMTKKHRKFFEDVYNGRIKIPEKMPLTHTFGATGVEGYILSKGFESMFSLVEKGVKTPERLAEAFLTATSTRHKSEKDAYKSRGMTVDTIISKEKIEKFFKENAFSSETKEIFENALKNTDIWKLVYEIMKRNSAKKEFDEKSLYKALAELDVKEVFLNPRIREYESNIAELAEISDSKKYDAEKIVKIFEKTTLADVLKFEGYGDEGTEIWKKAEKTTLKDVVNVKDVIQKVLSMEKTTIENARLSEFELQKYKEIKKDLSSRYGDILSVTTVSDVFRINEEKKRILESKVFEAKNTIKTGNSIMEKIWDAGAASAAVVDWVGNGGKLENIFSHSAPQTNFLRKIGDTIVNLKPEYRPNVYVNVGDSTDSVKPVAEAIKNLSENMGQSVMYLDGEIVARSVEKRRIKKARLYAKIS